LPSSGSPNVKRFSRNGYTFAIKNTAGLVSEGANFEGVRDRILRHQKTVRLKKINPKFYNLRTAKVYKRFGNFLVMKYVDEKSLWKGSKWSEKSFDRAKIELEFNFLKLLSRKPFEKENLPESTRKLFEFVQNENLWTKNVQGRKAFDRAIVQLRVELKSFFRTLNPKFPGGLLQIRDAIPVYNTNPSNPLKGKWVMSLPYDYTVGVKGNKLRTA